MLFAKYQLLETLDLKAGTEWPVSDTCWHFIGVTRGSGYWMIQSGPDQINAGDLLVVPPKLKGEIRASRLGDLGLRHFGFVPELLGGFLTAAESGALEHLSAHGKARPQIFRASEPAAREFVSIAAGETPPNDLTQRCRMLEVALSILSDRLPAAKPAPASRFASAAERFQQLIGSMVDSELIRHSPEELARSCGCSPRHFSRLFFAHFGVSFRAKQTEMRLHKACQLLLESDAKVIHVAMDSGYRHLGLFNAMFKRRFGMTPTEYRREHLKKNKRPTVRVRPAARSGGR